MLSLTEAVERAGPPPSPVSSFSQLHLPVGALGARALWVMRYVPEVSHCDLGFPARVAQDLELAPQYQHNWLTRLFATHSEVGHCHGVSTKGH